MLPIDFGGICICAAVGSMLKVRLFWNNQIILLLKEQLDFSDILCKLSILSIHVSGMEYVHDSQAGTRCVTI